MVVHSKHHMKAFIHMTHKNRQDDVFYYFRPQRNYTQILCTVSAMYNFPRDDDQCNTASQWQIIPSCIGSVRPIKEQCVRFEGDLMAEIEYNNYEYVFISV